MINKNIKTFYLNIEIHNNFQPDPCSQDIFLSVTVKHEPAQQECDSDDTFHLPRAGGCWPRYAKTALWARLAALLWRVLPVFGHDAQPQPSCVSRRLRLLQGMHLLNLLAQKRSIQENVAAYERFMETQDRKQQDEVLQKERETLQKALDAAEGAISGKATRTLDQARALATQKLKEKVDRATDDDKREAMKKTSFWIPDCTPTQETKVDKPDTKTRDPMSLDEMKLKHLMPVKLEWDTSAADGKPKVLCAVTKKEISHHRAVLLRPSGQVILESCLKDMVLPTMTCPVTGLKLRKKDIVYLQAGGTGFSAHSTVEAKKYRPTMT
ncbi:putative RING-type domain-containing protein [Phytophthora infestans]|uniref:Putative RING-type domain-containing protein n=1 Tax=Phytophthora infestans TaxID=4787 RepID=A0A833SI00_PHYIN|nr:putative RING-type domain-containing protein [Phytophthora infestans]